MAHRGDTAGFDRAAAVTRSLLGWGVVAGAFYLVVGVAQGLAHEAFDFSAHALSLLMLGDQGWLQTANLALTGLMVLAAAAGFARAMHGSRPGRSAPALLAVHGLCLIASAVFPPDPVAGYPEATAAGEASLSGLLHLAFGAIGFLCLAIAALAVATWLDRRGATSAATASRVAGAVVLVGFVGGAALSASAAGIVALWVAVVVGFAWLAAASVTAYRTVPHPDAARRVLGAAG